MRQMTVKAGPYSLKGGGGAPRIFRILRKFYVVDEILGPHDKIPRLRTCNAILFLIN